MKIKNWAKFQHFKDRTPPWIKLYRDILDDPDWHELTGDDAKVLISLWLLASESDSHDGALPDARRIAFRLRISEKQLKQSLTKLSHWLIHDDIDSISREYQNDAPETETETETETEESQRQNLVPTELAETASQVSAMPPCPIEKIIEVYHETLPTNPRLVVRNKTRDGYIKSRWREFYADGSFKTQEDGIECFRLYFTERVKKSRFLTGLAQAGNGGKPFIADLEWLMRPTNFAKVIEGKYL